MFSMRIVTTDHYLGSPIPGLDVCYNEYRGTDISKVPVLRLYGITPTGQKSCMHVHGVFPYIYIPYDGTEPVDRYLRQLTSSIDKALNVALGRASSTVQHVYKVSLVSGITFYGYHDEETFIKVYLYNPHMVKKVSDLLLGGAILNKVFQPFESHIPYQLQMFIDYNLYGMNMLHVAAVKFRHPITGENGKCDTPVLDNMGVSSVGNVQQVWDMENIPSEFWLDPSIERQSTCLLEVDVVAADILNRLEVEGNIGTNPGLAALWEDERQRRKERGDSTDISPPQSPERQNIVWSSSEARLQNELQDLIQNLQPFINDSESEEEDAASLKQYVSRLNTTVPSSQVELHLSKQTSDVSSVSTVMLNDEVLDDVVINEQTIQHVVSTSQSFTEDRAFDLNASLKITGQDHSLVQLLAALADDESPAGSQVAAQVVQLEDHDAVLSQQTAGCLSDEDQEQQHAESLEMSQRIIPDEDNGDDILQELGRYSKTSPVMDINLQGMDQSWNSSQWIDVVPQQAEAPRTSHAFVESSSSDDEMEGSCIPQLDGPVDVKSGAKHLNSRSPLSKPIDGKDHQADTCDIPSHAVNSQRITDASKKLNRAEKEFVNGGMTSHSKSRDLQHPEVIHKKLDLRYASSSFLQQGEKTPTKVLTGKSGQASGASPKAVRTVVNLSNMTVTPQKQTLNLLGARPIEKESKHHVRGLHDDRNILSPETDQLKKREYQDEGSSENSENVHDKKPSKGSTAQQDKSPSLVIRPGHLVPEKTHRPGKIQPPAVPKSCKIDLRSMVPSPVPPPRPTASTKAKMKDWAAAMTSMDKQVYNVGKTKPHLVKLPNSRRWYSPVDSMMEQVVPSKGLKTYIPPQSVRVNKQNSTLPPIRDPGMIVDAELKAEGKENTKKPARRVYRKHVSGIIPKEDKDKKSSGSYGLTSLASSNATRKEKSQPGQIQRLTSSDCETSKAITARIKHTSPGTVTNNKHNELSEHANDGKRAEKMVVHCEGTTGQPSSKSHRAKHSEKRARKHKKQQSIEFIDQELEANSSPERNNIFSVVTPEVPEVDSGKRSRTERMDREKKGLDEQSAAKIVKGLLGFKKNLFSGKSKEELKRIQERLNKMPGSKNAPVVLDDEDADERISPGNSLGQGDHSVQMKMKRRRRRRLSSKSSKGHQRTSAEQDAVDHENPDDYIIKGRRDSDSSADSDASFDLKAYVGAHQKTYEKPSYRVGDSFGKKTYVIDSDDTFNKVVTKEQQSRDDKQQDAKYARSTSDSLDDTNEDVMSEASVDDTVKTTGRRKSCKVRKSLIGHDKMVQGKGKRTFTGLLGHPAAVPKRKPLAPGRIRVTSTSPLRYFRGRRRSVLSSDSETECSNLEHSYTVQILKAEYDEYINELLGKECVVLAKMSPSEIEELKKQVKREMEHKRKEHIMPLVMQKTREEIEKEYEEVKRRVMEEMARDPPMPDYVDSDVEPLESDSDKSDLQKDSELNSDMFQVYDNGGKLDSCVSEKGCVAARAASAYSDISSDGEMPKLEPAVMESVNTSNSNTVTLVSSNVQDAVCEESQDVDGNITYVIVSQEEAESEGMLLVEDGTCQMSGEPLEVTTVMPDLSKDQIVVIDLDNAAVGEEQGSVENKAPAEEQWSDSVQQAIGKAITASNEAGMLAGTSAASEMRESGKFEDVKLAHRDVDPTKSGSSKLGKAVSRRSSLDVSQEKGEVAEVDFSLLEMDTDNEVQDGSLNDRELDTHKQLHTPPITIDSDQSQDAETLITPKKEPEMEVVDGNGEGDVFKITALSQDETAANCDKNYSLLTDDNSQISDSLVEVSGDFDEIDKKGAKKRKSADQVDDGHLKSKFSRSAGGHLVVCPVVDGDGSASTSPAAKSNKRNRSMIGSDEESTELKGQSKAHAMELVYYKLKPCFVRLKKLVMSGTTMLISECEKDRTDIMRGSSEFSGKYSHSIITDIVTEDSVDPLWEAHKQRLAVMTQPNRPQLAKRQKGPPKHFADYIIPDGTLPTAPKKPSPRKKVRDPFVRCSGRRAKKRTDQKKFLDKLSILHQYTLDSLNTANSTGDGHTSEEGNSSCSNVASGTESPVSTVSKTAAVPSYARDANDDHNCGYDDVMYKLALLSPEEQAVYERSKPQPTSPTHQPTGHDSEVDTKEAPRHESAASTVMIRAATSQSHDVNSDASLKDVSSSSSRSPELSQVQERTKEGVPYTVKTEVVRFGSGSQSPRDDAQCSQAGSSSGSATGGFNLSQPFLDESPTAVLKEQSQNSKADQSLYTSQPCLDVSQHSVNESLSAAVRQPSSVTEQKIDLLSENTDQDLIPASLASSGYDELTVSEERCSTEQQSSVDQSNYSNVHPLDRKRSDFAKPDVCSPDIIASTAGDADVDAGDTKTSFCQKEESFSPGHSGTVTCIESPLEWHKDEMVKNAVVQSSVTHLPANPVSSESSECVIRPHSVNILDEFSVPTFTSVSTSQQCSVPSSDPSHTCQSVCHLADVSHLQQTNSESLLHFQSQESQAPSVSHQRSSCLPASSSQSEKPNLESPQAANEQSVHSRDSSQSQSHSLVSQSVAHSFSHRITPQSPPHSASRGSSPQGAIKSTHSSPHSPSPSSYPQSPPYRAIPHSPQHSPIPQSSPCNTLHQTTPHLTTHQLPSHSPPASAIPEAALQPKSPAHSPSSQSLATSVSLELSSHPSWQQVSQSQQLSSRQTQPVVDMESPCSPSNVHETEVSASGSLPVPLLSGPKLIPQSPCLTLTSGTQSASHACYPETHSPSSHPIPHSPSLLSTPHSLSPQSAPHSPSSQSAPPHSASPQSPPHSPSPQSPPHSPSPQSPPHSPSPQSPPQSPPHSPSPQSPPHSPSPQSPPHSSSPQSPPQSPPHSPSPQSPPHSPSPQSPPRSPSPQSPPRSPSPQSPPHSPSPQSQPHSPSPQSQPHSPSPQSQPHSPSPPAHTSWSLSPPRSPSPIRSPDPHRVHHSGRSGSHMPAVIPLTIEDPQIQEEVEKARRVKLMKLLGHGSLKPDAKHQTPIDPQCTGEMDGPHDSEHNPHGQTAAQSTTSGHGQSADLSSQSTSESGHTKGDGQPSGRMASATSADDPRTLIQPVQHPPSRARLLETAQHHSLGEYQAKEAYCSKPEDVPVRPRELGGRLLKVHSALVSDLPEATTSLSQHGLSFWKDLMIRRNLENLDCSQGSVADLLSQARNTSHLIEALFGDQVVILTPCKPPPTYSNVCDWLKGKEIYRKAKMEAMKVTAREEPNEEPKENTERTKGKGKGKGKTSENIKHKEVSDRFMGVPILDYSDEEESILQPEDQQLSSSKAQDYLKPTQQDSMKREKSVSFATDTSSILISASIMDDEPVSKPIPHPDVENVIQVGRKVMASTPIKPTNLELSPSHSPEQLPCTPIEKLPGTPMEVDVINDSLECEALSESFLDQASPSPLQYPVTGDNGDESDDDIIPPTPETSQRKRSRTPRTPFSENKSADSTKSLRRVLLTTQLKNQFSTPKQSDNISQIEGPTPKNSFGFKVCSENIQDAKALHEYQYLTVMSVEVHATTRADLRPDPEFDALRCIFYSLLNDVPGDKDQRKISGVMIADEESAKQTDVLRCSEAGASCSSASSVKGSLKQTLLQKSGITNLNVTYFENEEELIVKFVEFVRRIDPDILVGFEIQMLSWGYVIQRGYQLGLNIAPQLSRVPDHTKDTHSDPEKDPYGSDHMSEINIAGRIVINLWRILRHQVTLNVYTFENCVFHILHHRVPLYSFKTLTEWFEHSTHLHRWRTVEYYFLRCKGNIELMEKVDLIGQTSEFARVFGIEFYHVLSRGTQYRVESMMLRIAKPMNYIPVSPGIQQRSRMRAPECIPLNLEPESKLYTHPVVVLDFQSLYPSIMIAYNYCYSTCLGRLEHLSKCNEGSFEFGCTSLNITPKLLKKLKNDITVCPNGVAFVKQHIRKGILPRMVGDILKTRLMVKKSMKDYKEDKTLQRLLHARQLGLKLIANVTFGYTSANFSGRMPCVEIGDSIVRKARETLERAIEMVENTPKWGARVVYGDTDSMFILLEGRTKDQAFIIGQEIADAVTNDNPKPVKLKFEKVYLPCVLQTKKRYIGFMYETPEQKEPVFDAKGIETVRRDNCAAVSKILEKSVKILFTTCDISSVKRYVQHQCQKLMEGNVSIQDCVFAKEYRGMSGYRPGACVPALQIAKNRLSKDRRSEPRVGERVPYVIVYGTPGLPLIQLVREPQELIEDASLRINSSYYVTKQILPPLDRIFSLIGVDVFLWYKELPRVVRAVPPSHFTSENKKGTISQYFTTLACPVCEVTTTQGTCQTCRIDPQRVAVVINSRIQKWQRTFYQLIRVCNSCMGCPDPTLPCISLDCPILYRITKASRDYSQCPDLEKIQDRMLQF